VDMWGPELNMITPIDGVAVQDVITVSASAYDVSTVSNLYFTLREDNGYDGMDIGYEALEAEYNRTSDLWETELNSLQIPDGFYLMYATAVDTFGNESVSESVHFSIRNWAVVTLLPSSTVYTAGRTLPIKFSLNINGAVDPEMPFVVNENLMVTIANGERMLQVSQIGSESTDYRIDYTEEHYITNFKTDKTPDEYFVDIWRNTDPDFLIDGFSFVSESDHRMLKQWKSGMFTAEQLRNPVICGDLCDPDHDGIVNFIEFAYGLNPLHFDKNGNLAYGIQHGHFTMTYSQNKDAEDLLFIVESSSDLGAVTWSDVGVKEISRVDSNTYWSVTVQDAQPISEKDQGFMRLKIEIAE